MVSMVRWPATTFGGHPIIFDLQIQFEIELLIERDEHADEKGKRYATPIPKHFVASGYWEDVPHPVEFGIPKTAEGELAYLIGDLMKLLSERNLLPCQYPVGLSQRLKWTKFAFR